MFSMSFFSNNFLVFHCFCRKRHIISSPRSWTSIRKDSIVALRPNRWKIGCWLEDSWVFICFYGFLRGFSWFFCLVTRKVTVYKNGSEGLDPPLQVPHRASPTHKPAISIVDPGRSRSIHLDPFHYVSLVHNGHQHFQFSGIKVVKDYQKPWLKQEKFQILIKSSKRQP